MGSESHLNAFLFRNLNMSFRGLLFHSNFFCFLGPEPPPQQTEEAAGKDWRPQAAANAGCQVS